MYSAGEFEAKAKKEIRKNGGLPRGSVLFIEEDGTFRTFALRIFFSSLLIKRTDVVFSPKADGARKVSGETLDDVSCGLLENVFCGTVPEHIAQAKTCLCPFAAIPVDEVLAYAKQFGWAGEVSACESQVRGFLSRFAKDHPATPFALKNIRDSLITMDLKHD